MHKSIGARCKCQFYVYFSVTIPWLSATNQTCVCVRVCKIQNACVVDSQIWSKRKMIDQRSKGRGNFHVKSDMIQKSVVMSKYKIFTTFPTNFCPGRSFVSLDGDVSLWDETEPLVYYKWMKLWCSGLTPRAHTSCSEVCSCGLWTSSSKTCFSK